MNWTPEQKQKLIQVSLTAFISLVISVASIFGYNLMVVQPSQVTQNAAWATQVATLQAQLGIEPNTSGPNALAGVPYNLSALPMRCKNQSINCVEIWNGSAIKMYADGATTATFSVDGATGNVVTAGSITSSGVFTASGILRVGTASTISVTNNSIITPTATYQPLQSAGTVTATALATTGYYTGQVVTLINTSATSILLTNGTNLKLPGAANLTLGQYDAVELWYDGTRWVTISASNN